MKSIKERVAKGAALLDAKYPDWRDKINLETFDIACMQNCVVGQVSGMGYVRGLRKLLPEGDELYRFATNHGFGAVHRPMQDEWDEMNEEWKRTIEQKDPNHERALETASQV